MAGLAAAAPLARESLQPIAGVLAAQGARIAAIVGGMRCGDVRWCSLPRPNSLSTTGCECARQWGRRGAAR